MSAVEAISDSFRQSEAGACTHAGMLRIGMVLQGDVSRDIRVLNEASYLHTQGHEVYILTPRYPSAPVAGRGFTHITAPLKGKWIDYFFGTVHSLPLFQWFWSRHVAAFAAKYCLDLLHAHDLYMAPPVQAAARKLGIPVVVDLHENYPAAIALYAWTRHPLKRMLAKPHLWSQREGSILGNCQGIITLSETYAAQLKQAYPTLRHRPMAAYPNVPNVAELLAYDSSPAPLKLEGAVLLYFGLVARRRGLQTASEGVAALNCAGISCTLLIIGMVDQNEQQWFDHEVMHAHVHHIPWIELKELRSYTSLAQVCISPLLRNPQHESGVANKIFQYMLYEKPLLVSDCAPQKAIVENEACGRWHRSGDVHSFADVLRAMLEHPDQLAEMGHRGREAVLRRYNTAVMGHRLQALYGQVLSGTKTHSPAGGEVR